MKTATLILGAVVSFAALTAGSAWAGATPEEAAKLKSELTPFGAIKAGNKDGSIPAWTGGLTKPLVPSTGPLPANQFPSEKPLFVIDQKTVAQYADKLSEGQKALIAKDPAYKLVVYPSHRTYSQPDWVYENNYRNALNGQVTANGMSVKGVYGGTPFPIPKAGIELFWNHTLRYQAQAYQLDGRNFTGNADGSVTMTVRATNYRQGLYYRQDTTAETWKGEFGFGRLQNTGPAFKAGEMLVIRDSVDPENPRQAWQYLVGQRRVRRAPTVGYDTPDFVSSGANYFDEAFGFWGSPDRYDWKLIGKREMYVPYNENGFAQASIAEAITPNHPNPDKVRWELHRVWEVELTLANGKRHVVPKRKLYFDEDSYAVLLSDGYDSTGKLWRTSHTMPITVDGGWMFYDGTVVYNLQAGTYSFVLALNEGSIKETPPRPDSFYTGDALASDGVR